MTNLLRKGDTFSGPYKLSFVDNTGKITVENDFLTYQVIDVDFAVNNSKRYQNVSFQVTFNNGNTKIITAGTYDRCLNHGQLSEKNGQLDLNIDKTINFSLSSNNSLIVKFSKNASPNVISYLVYTAILPKLLY